MTALTTYAGDERRLIVNADDFGRTPGINRGVAQAYEHGVVTSASLMVRWPAAVDAAAYSRTRPELSLGLHLDLGEWIYRDAEWRSVYAVVDTADATAVAAEAAAQIDAFRRMVGNDPTHLDSHQHVHLREPVRDVVLQQGRSLGVPVRGYDPGVRHCGDFYGQTGAGEPWPDGITVAAMVEIIRSLGPGVTELSCHPGLDGDFDSVYRHERATEVEVLCHPDARRGLEENGVLLTAFPPARVPPTPVGTAHEGASDV